jgi:hypothetical protein
MQKANLPSVFLRSNAIFRDLMQPNKTRQESDSDQKVVGSNPSRHAFSKFDDVQSS